MNKIIKEFHKKLHTWYAQYGRRDLPWRNTDDPYAIYISEIMLQQTQVKTVLERYYFPFLKRFPTLGKLAAAKQDDVLSAWQGLGYYNRAINLHNAAKSCKKLPDAVDDLVALPGIGRNTAHAVAAFAFRKPVAVMEANVKRVLCRIFALQAPVDADLWDKAAQLLDDREPFDYNQAMMDIGATICTKRAPKCGECPANSICEGKSNPESYPAPKVKKSVPVRRKHIEVLKSNDGLYYAAPRSSRFLNGLYHFNESDTPQSRGIRIGGVRQQYSHFTLEGDVWLVSAGAQKGKHWHTEKQLAGLPFSMAEQKILALLAEVKTAKPKIKKRT